MNKLYVNKGDIIREYDLPAETEKARDEFVEIITRGQGACRLARLDEHAPDISESIRTFNSHLVVLADSLEAINEGIQDIKRNSSES